MYARHLEEMKATFQMPNCISTEPGCVEPTEQLSEWSSWSFLCSWKNVCQSNGNVWENCWSLQVLLELRKLERLEELPVV